MSLPLVTVSILNYRRRDAVTKVLQSLREQDYPAIQTIVVDNASQDGTAEFIRSEFPEVQLVELPENIGTSARNRGIELARGEYIITIDNDVYFDSPDGIRRVIAAFDRHPKASCLVFRIYHPETGSLHLRDWSHPRPWQEAENLEFETYYLTEGASAFRRSIFSQLEGYWKDLFIASEGTDMAYRMMNAGYEIWYVPDVKVWHMASLETRESWRPFYYNTRSLIMLAYRHYPFWQGVAWVVPRAAVLGFYGARSGYFGKFAAGVWDGLRSWPKVKPKRKVVRAEVLHKVATMRQAMPSAFTRFLRHWKKHEF